MIEQDDARIPDPLARDLRPALSPERVDRLWRDISAARAGELPRRPSLVRSPAFAVAAAVCVMLAGFGLLRALGASNESVRASAALVRADGTALEVIAPRDRAASVPLSDGSELWVGEGAVLTPLDVSERSVVLHLVRGRTRFSVKPGGPRRWVIEAGHASVEVVGTRFSVERDAAGVTVQVEEGKVLVRSGAVPDGVVRLGAGERVRVPARVPVETPDDVRSGEVTPVEPPPPSQQASAPVREPAPEAPRATPPKVRAASDADALFVLADDARVARDYGAAIEALERVIREHGRDPRAKLAAFTIGRIRDEQFRDLAGATLAYEKALALGLAGSLAEDCYSRLLRVLDAQVREGRVPRSRLVKTAQQYLQRHPKGRYVAEARSFSEGKVAP